MVSDNPAGDGKIASFFYSERYFTDHLGVLRIISSIAERIRIRSSEAARVSSNIISSIAERIRIRSSEASRVSSKRTKKKF